VRIYHPYSASIKVTFGLVPRFRNVLLQFGTLFTCIVLRRWRPDDRLTHLTECYWSSIPRHASVFLFIKNWISLFCCSWRLVSCKEKNCIVFSGYGTLQSEMKEKLKITVSSGDFNLFGKIYRSERVTSDRTDISWFPYTFLFKPCYLILQ